jgi:uncharacterized protein (DUF58 family)
MAFVSRRRLIAGSVVLGLALVVGVVWGYLAGIAVVIVAAMALMVVYMRGHGDVLLTSDTQEGAAEWSRKRFGSDEDSND